VDQIEPERLPAEWQELLRQNVFLASGVHREAALP